VAGTKLTFGTLEGLVTRGVITVAMRMAYCECIGEFKTQCKSS